MSQTGVVDGMTVTDRAPCRVCQKIARSFALLPLESFTCDACWEVEHRLEEYLKSANGREHVREALAKAAGQ